MGVCVWRCDVRVMFELRERRRTCIGSGCGDVEMASPWCRELRACDDAADRASRAWRVRDVSRVNPHGRRCLE